MNIRLINLGCLGLILLGSTQGLLVAQVTESLAVTQLKAKMIHIVLPEVKFNETPIDDAFKQLAAKSKELDPDHEGINLVLKLPPNNPASNKTVTISLNKVTLDDALRLITSLTDLTYDVEDHAVVIHPAVVN